MKKNKNIPGTVIGIIIIVAVIAAIVFGAIYITGIKKSSAVPEGVAGNTSGNLNNRGRFCESDGYIYFANPYDSQKLYRMKSDESEPECIAAISAEFINVYGNNVYFYEASGGDNQIFGLGSQYGVCRCDTEGKAGTSFIDKAICNSLILYGPNLYYQHYDPDEGLKVYRASTKNKSKKKISDKEVYLSCPVNGRFYCYNPENMYNLAAFNPSTDQYEPAPVSARVYNVTYDSGYLYFMNIEDDYKIYRMGISAGGMLEKIVDTKVDTFNVYGDNVFYQVSSDDAPVLMHLNMLTGQETVVAEGNYTNINCTAGNTYFYEYNNDAAVYSVSTSGGRASAFRLKQ